MTDSRFSSCMESSGNARHVLLVGFAGAALVTRGCKTKGLPLVQEVARPPCLVRPRRWNGVEDLPRFCRLRASKLAPTGGRRSGVAWREPWSGCRGDFSRPLCVDDRHAVDRSPRATERPGGGVWRRFLWNDKRLMCKKTGYTRPAPWGFMASCACGWVSAA